MNIQTYDPAILRNRLNDITHQMRQINDRAESEEDRKLTSDEKLRWDSLTAEHTEVKALLEETEQRARTAELVRASRAHYGSMQVGNESTPNYSVHDVARMGPIEARDNARRLLDQARHLQPHQGDHVEQLLTAGSLRNVESDHIARLIVLTESPEYRSAFMQVMTNAHPVLSSAEADAVRAVQEYRAMVEGTPSAGGYGVPALIDPTIILTAQQAANPFLRISTVKTITTREWKGVSSDGVTWSWDAEAAEVSDDSPSLGQPTIPVHTARGFVPFSIELEQDYPSFSTEVAGLLAEGYADLTVEAFTIGTGSGQPTGIFTALDANTNVEVVVTTDGAFGVVDISKVWTALPGRARANASWLMHEDVKEVTRSWGDDFWTRTVSLQGADFRIREREVVTSDKAPEFTGSTGAANLLVVGDFRKYYIVQRAGMTMEYVPHLFGTTNNRPTGQRGWFAWARVGADSVDDKAFRLLQNQ